MSVEVALEHGQDVVVEVPGMGRIDARVDEVEGKRLALALYLPPGTLLRVAGAQDAVVEFTAPRGVYRVVGIVRDLKGDGQTLHFHQELDPALIQRREFARVDVIVPVKIWLQEGFGDQIEANTLNVSGNGMLLNGAQFLRPGDGFWFALEIADDEPPLEGRARVVREGARGQRGCAIEEIAEKSRDRLVRFIFERQRLERLTAGWEER